MFNEKMTAIGQSRSVIRELYEYGKKLASERGAENVFDFSIGDPSVPTPGTVENTAKALLGEAGTHGYTSAQGLISVREAVAKHNRDKYGLPLKAERVYMTCGAAAALAISLRAVLSDSQDEAVVIAPFFPEYRIFIENAGGKTVTVPADEKNFQIDTDALRRALTPRTAAVIINSPNNPSGSVYTENTLRELADALENAERRFGTTIALISDEPYREIVYEGKTASPLCLYDDAILCYSYSKSLSLPGERIGYVAVSDRMKHADLCYAAILGAGRSLGYVCAPSLFQRVVERCCGEVSDIAPYRENRDILLGKLAELGLVAADPRGAFYVLVKAPGGDAVRFCEAAKLYGLLLVPTDSFSLPGYVRIATCVKKDMLLRALPVFEKFVKEYK